MSTVLVIDDEPAIHEVVQTALGEAAELQSAISARDGIERFAEARPDVVILDLNLPDMTGLEVYQRLHKLDARVPVIFLTGAGTTETAIEAMALGAYDYLLKPVQLAALRAVVLRAVEVRRLMALPPRLGEIEASEVAAPAEALVGRCAAMQAVYKSIGRVAPRDVTVLILGESGTGKELVARAIYHHSRRAEGPFLAINCAAIPETLLESELFGHVQGAFTGADRTRIGKFEQCSGGTLFLDEVGEMSPLTQTKLLRVLQEQSFERVGGNQTIKTDVRILAATNRNLDEQVANGRFRQDLYYRLNVYALHMPPLRERGDDLHLLLDYLLRRFSSELGSRIESAAPETIELLRRHSWPGNVRELQSVVQYAILQGAGTVLTPESLPSHIRDHGPQPLQMPNVSEADDFIERRLREGSENLYAEWLEITERRLFEHVLRHCRDNLTAAAKRLGIHRATLRTRLQQLGIRSGEKTAGE